MAHNKLLLSKKQSNKDLAEAAAHGPFTDGTLQGGLSLFVLFYPECLKSDVLKSKLAFVRISSLSEIRMFGFQTFTVFMILLSDFHRLQHRGTVFNILSLFLTLKKPFLYPFI